MLGLQGGSINPNYKYWVIALCWQCMHGTLKTQQKGGRWGWGEIPLEAADTVSERSWERLFQWAQHVQSPFTWKHEIAGSVVQYTWNSRVQGQGIGRLQRKPRYSKELRCILKAWGTTEAFLSSDLHFKMSIPSSRVWGEAWSQEKLEVNILRGRVLHDNRWSMQ